jgi:ATP-binding cassette subfamily F protein 3
VGKNGAGKSTLLNILAGDLQSDQGQLALEKGLQIGFLKQDIDFFHGRTVLEEAYEAFSELMVLEKDLERVNTELAERTDYESDGYHQLMVDLNEITHRYELLGGYTYKGETEKVLQGLGFRQDDFDKSTDTFSGGWRMRIELTKLLLQKNDILLLDEPTNHLDIESIIWLEQFLTDFSGAVVLVSHDRMFLDNITNRTLEISLGRIYDYNKPYSGYLKLREEIREQQRNAKKNQDREIQQAERLIERFRAKSSKASMAQSMIKKLEKMERIEVDEEALGSMNIRFPLSVVPGKVVVEMAQVSKSYGEKQVLTSVDLLLERGSKTAFVGQNGQGKTTLARILVGELEHGGTVKLGHNVQLGYFAQDQADSLDGNKTVLDTMIDAANEQTRPRVRDILGSFLFSGDEVEKYVKVLSGGERNRLALAKLLLQPFNVLVMDEPTNHLDMKSKQILKEALQQFEGTLILVSHDRDFLQGLTNKVYEFRGGGIKEYLGDIQFYLDQRQLENFRELEKKDPDTVSREKSKGKSGSYEDQKKIKSLKNRLSSVEKKIAALEKELAEIDHQLVMDYDATIAKTGFFDRYQERKKSLEVLMEQWEELTINIENLSFSG